MTATATDVRRFAFRQGPGRTLLNAPVEVDDSAPTTAMLTPRTARGTRGTPLPLDTREVLDNLHYPAWPAAHPAQLGHVLVAAFGLQRREPSNAFNDHRVIASVRSKFPVHAFVVPDRGAPSYLDLYRHALVELDAPDVPDGLRPPAGSTTIILAARYTDLPTGYARLRGALTELEMGVNLRSLFDAADLIGASARLSGGGPAASNGAQLLRSTGAGAWGPAMLVVLEGCVVPSPSAILSAGGAPPAALDALLDEQAAHWSVDEAAEVAGQAYGLGNDDAVAAHGLPAAHDATGLSWSTVLWARTAGRAPKGVSGFTVTPCQVTAQCLTDMVSFAGVPAPSPLLRAVARRVHISVAVQRTGDLPTGVYRLIDGDLQPVRSDPLVMNGIQRQFGYPLSPYGACGIRHASAVWALSANVNSLIADLGPGAWTLLQRWCGWVSHGICTACAAHGLFARPARSYDEYAMQGILGLPAGEVPTLITVCGRTQFAEPALDLRT